MPFGKGQICSFFFGEFVFIELRGNQQYQTIILNGLNLE